jgi:hypothetical protein
MAAGTPAALGTARLNNFRLNYMAAALTPIRQTRVSIFIADVQARHRVRVGSLSIRDILNDLPNTCTLTIEDTAPTEGQSLRITIDSDAPRVLFAGTLQQVVVAYAGRPENTVWRCAAIDDFARINRLRPFGSFTNVSATTIAQTIVAQFAPGFSAGGVEAGLPVVSIIFDGQDTFMRCLARLATLIGGYCNALDRVVYLFRTASGPAPDPIDAAHPFLHDPPIANTVDSSQLRTRMYGKGHRQLVPVDVLASDTVIPLPDVVMFNPQGGLALAGTTPDGAQSQRLTYTGTRSGGGGSLIGTGGGPSVKPTVTAVSGAGLATGPYQYAYTHVTAAGETLPSPLATLQVPGPKADPSTACVAAAYVQTSDSKLTLNASYTYRVAFSDGVNETLAGPPSAPYVATANSNGKPQAPYLQQIPFPGTAGQGVFTNLYRSVNGGTYRRSIRAAADQQFGAVTYLDAFESDADLAARPTLPTANTMPPVNRVTIAAVALGGSGVTARKVYRTAVNGSQLKLQQTIANNTATTGVTDATPDASLGANAPTVDTSGLVFAAGSVRAGTTTIPITSPGPFTAPGYARVGNQVVRYSSVGDTSLDGIPASGPGSIFSTIVYGTVITPHPCLVGVTGLALPLLQGTPVHVWVQRDDTGAQAAQAAIDAANGRVPADGVFEGPPIVDARRGEPSLIALCDAHLALFSRPVQTVMYATRDLKTASGKTVVVSLTDPPIHATLTIQDVTITEIDIAPGLAPRFAVTASTVRFSLEDLIGRMATELGV